MIVKTKYSLSGIISSALIAAIFAVSAFAQNAPHHDNDDDYKLPTYVPKVAQPNAPSKVIFQDDGAGNDEMYSMHTKAAKASPAAAPVQQQAQPQYQQSIPAYQPQVQQYQPRAQQQAQPQQYRQAPADADTYYRLPDQYSPQRNQQAPQQQQQQPQQAAPSKGYYQKYDYNDTRGNTTPDKNQKQNDYYPTYYY